MQEIINWLVSLNIPLINEPVARFIMHLVLASIVAVVAPAMLIILTWLERKIIARIQDRIGPNRAGPYGLLQGIADMIKMFTKEDITRRGAGCLTILPLVYRSFRPLWFLRLFLFCPRLYWL